MARRNSGDEERSMDSLMDAMTNVVGILLLILIITSLGITTAVEKILDNIPEVSQEELEEMKVSRKKTLDTLQDLIQTQQTVIASQIKPKEAAQLKLELEEFEKDNKDLADKTSDIDEWKNKVEEEKKKKVAKETKVIESEKEDRRLAAILAQTPEAKVAIAREIKLPNPRRAEEADKAHYFICKFNKLYYIGDPYVHTMKIRDVIDQNFKDLAYTGKGIGSYTHTLKSTKKNDARTGYLAHAEDFRLTRSAEKTLVEWTKINSKIVGRDGKEAADANLLKRLFGNDDKREFQVHKFRFDRDKIAAFFKDGKMGPADFKYHVSPDGDGLKLALEPKEDGGWPIDSLATPEGNFDKLCRTLQNQHGTVFYYHVAADSFETYLTARTKSETHRIKAGWTVLLPDTVSPQSSILLETTRYNLDVLPDANYMAVANSSGAALIAANATEIAEFTQRVNAAADKAIADKSITPAEKQQFVNSLTVERRSWDVSYLQQWGLNIYRTALAASEASGLAEVVMEANDHPPKIPQIRLFSPSSPPTKPRPPAVVKPKQTNTDPNSRGGSKAATVTLD
ncbi:hypothetical protein OAE61_00335 [Verrucomicrobiales bacterium]|nr:hypothetical protein [bacterium]MDB4662060.1 hypothetical protein [Verrucomicrobiales bacterium]MDC0276084.1 hypothetical protein [Verrucomicrobiales bacterium]